MCSFSVLEQQRGLCFPVDLGFNNGTIVVMTQAGLDRCLNDWFHFCEREEGLTGGDGRVGGGREAAANAVDHQEQLLVGSSLLNPPFPCLSCLLPFLYPPIPLLL